MTTEAAPGRLSDLFSDCPAYIPSSTVEKRMEQVFGVKRHALARMVSAKRFPRPIKLSSRKHVYAKAAVLAALDRMEQEAR